MFGLLHSDCASERVYACKSVVIVDHNVRLFRESELANIDFFLCSFSSSTIYNYILLLIDKYLQICIQFYIRYTNRYGHICMSVDQTSRRKEKEKIKRMIIISIMVKWERLKIYSQSCVSRKKTKEEKKMTTTKRASKLNRGKNIFAFDFSEIWFASFYFVPFASSPSSSQ